MKKNSAFLAFLLLFTVRCFALDATFLKLRACVPVGNHAVSCEIDPGDTLWRFAIKSDSSIKTIVGFNPTIVDPNLIYSGRRVILPDAAAPEVTSTTKIAAEITLLVGTTRVKPKPEPQETLAAILASIGMEDHSSMFTSLESLGNIPAMTVTIATPPTHVQTAAMNTTPAKVTGYQFMVSGSNLQGPLQTQLLLFDSEEEKKLILPCGNCRIDLKPSWAVPAQDGDGMVYVHLKKLPAQPFLLLVGGINIPIDSAQIRPYSGKTPGVHPFLRTMASIGKIGAQGGISLAVTGNPLIALGVVGGPRLLKFFIEQHEKSAVRKLAVAQAAVDKSKLALYRASTESNTLSKEIQ